MTIGVGGTAGDFDQQDGDDNPMWTRLERKKWMPGPMPSHGGAAHLPHARTISPVTFAAVERWFAYDQVGSILAETDAD